ncbi:MAG: hypothetical protein M1823_003483 [Watsoniomyces obsoletus]|nr:MAG: hypothetical protein M1823_003483 [Watsoniomyces obsoletus]
MPTSMNLLWEQALKAKPKDENLARECFFALFTQREWAGAQKAAVALHRMSNRRDYWFWVISCYHLLDISPQTSETDRKLFRALAYRMISKAAADAPTELGAHDAVPKFIQTPQELHLLLLIYIHQEKFQELLEIFDSKTFGISSRVAKGDWRFVRAKIELLESQGQWHDLWFYCKTLLSDADDASKPATGDNVGDWRVWQGLIRADSKIKTPRSTEATGQLIRSHADVARLRRSAFLAELLRLRLRLASPAGGAPEDQSELLSGCKQYFDATATKACCYDDIRDHVRDLSPESWESLLSHAEDVCKGLLSAEGPEKRKGGQWHMAKVNVLKIRFQMQLQRRLSSEQLQAVAVDAIKLYESSLSTKSEEGVDYQPGDDACIIAAMAFVHLAHREGYTNQHRFTVRYLQAAGVLESMTRHSGFNYQALLILVRLYLVLGCGSLAISTYSRLAIKNIQQDTMSHNLFTRISTIHPWPVSDIMHDSADQDDRDPRLGLQKALKVYEKSGDSIPNMVKLGIEEGSYGQVIGFLELGEKILHSMCRFMWEIERQRVIRCRNIPSPPTGASGIDAKHLPARMSDNRDFEVMVSYEPPEQPHFEELIHVGPTPGEQWVRGFAIAEQIVLRISQSKTPDGAQDASSQLTPILVSEGFGQEFTVPEGGYLVLVDMIDTMQNRIRHVSDDDSVRTRHLEQLMARLEKAPPWKEPSDFFDDMKNLSLEEHQPSYPCWEDLHEAFTRLEELRLMKMFAPFLGSPKKSKGQKTTKMKAPVELDRKITEVYESVKRDISRQKNDLDRSGVMGTLVDLLLEREKIDLDQGEVGSALETLLGEAWLETFVASVVDSWQDALDGVLRVKLE